MHIESVLNAATRLVYRLRRYDHINDPLATLPWLRLPERVDFKVAVTALFAWPCSTIFESDGSHRWPAWSSPTLFVVVTNLQILNVLLFCRSTVDWCSLPLNIQSSPSLTIFHQRLKTLFFRKSFPHILLWHYCFHRTCFHALRNSFAIWATLKLAFDIDTDIHSLPSQSSACPASTSSSTVTNWLQPPFPWSRTYLNRTAIRLSA